MSTTEPKTNWEKIVNLLPLTKKFFSRVRSIRGMLFKLSYLSQIGFVFETNLVYGTGEQVGT
jgi:hypothetical protein